MLVEGTQPLAQGGGPLARTSVTATRSCPGQPAEGWGATTQGRALIIQPQQRHSDGTRCSSKRAEGRTPANLRGSWSWPRRPLHTSEGCGSHAALLWQQITGTSSIPQVPAPLPVRSCLPGGQLLHILQYSAQVSIREAVSDLLQLLSGLGAGSLCPSPPCWHRLESDSVATSWHLAHELGGLWAQHGTFLPCFLTRK